MGSRGLRCLLIVFALVGMSAHAFAEKRVALLVGISAYQNVAKLPNPAKDAESMAELFKMACFDVVSLERDVSNLDFKRAIRRFEDVARDADIAVVFYAGHGIEIGGVNYLVPVDAKLASDLDAADEAITLDRLVESVDSSKKLGLVILDACRDNPFVALMKRQRQASRSVSAGLGKIEPTVAGTLIAYAARAGSVAEDGVGDHSPFTTALLANLTSPGLDVRLAFGRVRDQVMKLTSQRQEPFVYGSLGGATVAIVGTPEKIAAQAAASGDGNTEARRDYEYFERVGTKEAWDAFLQLHASGPYSDLARMQRARVVAAVEAGKARSTSDVPPANKPVDKPADKPGVVATAAPTMPSTATAPPSSAGPAPGETARLLQTELKRVGCYVGAVDGDWSSGSRRALDAFNKNAGSTVDSKSASLDALDAVRQKQTRVCPLECGRGQKVDGEKCVAITCEAGYSVGDSGNCEPSKGKTATRTPPSQKRDAAPRTPAPSSGAAAARAGNSGGSGAVACNRFGCQPVPRGCHVESSTFRDEAQQTVVCH